MTLRLPRQMVDEMVAHALDDLPYECCGVIAGKASVATKLYRARNAEASPYRYNIHPQDLLRISQEIDERDWEVMVIYHSHVASEAYPSATDIRLAQWPGTSPPSDLFPGAWYVLVSLKDRDAPVVRAFQISAGEVTEEEIETH
ncbi:MAG: M67 family metallopeptidase [Gemmatimonadales bacterium]|nr:M67 family metallopeptidase [Gemmatimonadales bacterium]